MSAPKHEPVISADSHVIEPHDLWERMLPPSVRDRAPTFERESTFERHPGAGSAADRLAAVAEDGVLGEVLYPSLALSMFTLRDVELQEACLRVYNDWLIDYCSESPGRLIGLPALCAYDIDGAIAEADRCHEAGLQGALLWLVPDPDIPYSSLHYEPMWEWAASTGSPVSLHILSGFDHTSVGLDELNSNPRELYKLSVNTKIKGVADTVYDLVFSGVFDRHPNLKIVLAEVDAGWVPFYTLRWDYYFDYDAKTKHVLDLRKKPSEYLDESVWITFVDDPIAGHLLQRHGKNRWMWSSDFPHPSSTWPTSLEKIDEMTEGIDADTRTKAIYGTAASLYRFEIPGC